MTVTSTRFRALALGVLLSCLAATARAETIRKTSPRIAKTDNFGCIVLEEAQDMQTLERNRDKRGME